MSRKNTKLIGAAVALVILLVSYGYDNIKEAKLFGNEPKISKSVKTDTNWKDLYDNVQVGEKQNVTYKRAEWANPGKTFDGFYIRDAAINKSVWTKSGQVNKYSIVGTDFQYEDPYTGNIITKAKRDIEWDHIVPIGYVNSHGGSEWKAETKNKYYYDLNVGVDVSMPANRSKSYKGPSEYMPAVNKAAYCYTWLVVANEYGIKVSSDDMKVIKEVLQSSSDKDIHIINAYK